MHNHWKIGVDLGGTKTEIVLLDSSDTETYRSRIKTPREDGYDAILNAVCGLVSGVMDRVPKGAPATVGIGMPGSINPGTGLVQNANTTCLIGRPLESDLHKLLGRPVGLKNDADCFTLAEARAGAGAGYDLVFGVIMGTGCGGGICIGGEVRSGPHNISGEWGHFAIDPQGEPCYCGNRGCVETKISGGGVEKAFYARYGRWLSMEQIAAGFRRGNDPQCAEAMERFLDDFGRSLGGLISILDPDAVVLGGGLSHIDELYTLGAERVRRFVFHEDIRTPILKNRLGDSAGVLGAAWIGK